MRNIKMRDGHGIGLRGCGVCSVGCLMARERVTGVVTVRDYSCPSVVMVRERVAGVGTVTL
jgi:hypothetical protein